MFQKHGREQIASSNFQSTCSKHKVPLPHLKDKRFFAVWTEVAMEWLRRIKSRLIPPTVAPLKFFNMLACPAGIQIIYILAVPLFCQCSETSVR